jgi:predicted dehydrogenase
LTSDRRACDERAVSVLRVGVIGLGYWGPHLVRNFSSSSPLTKIVAIADRDEKRRALIAPQYPWATIYEDGGALIADPDVDAVVIATPIFTHFELAKAALTAGKHVLVEKPMAPSVAECEELVALAETQGRVLMVDHTLLYKDSVRKIHELIAGGALGRVLYFDSVRINLGLFQPDYNVIWDLAPHDVSIMDLVLDQTSGVKPKWVSATGVSHYGKHENLAYVTIGYGNELVAHLHVNWVAPVKTRRITIAGTRKMIVWDDTTPVEPVKLYESSVDVSRIDKASAYELNIQYRTGDIVAPKLDGREALAGVVASFAGSCLRGDPSPSDAQAGLRVVRVLEAAQKSLAAEGARIAL